MNPDDYRSRERWFGSYYELAIEFYPRGDDARLLRAVAAMWASPLLHGPWPEREQLGRTPASPQRLDAEGFNRLYGVLHLPQGTTIGCGSLTVREEQGADWLDFYLPMGMLERMFPITYPLDRARNPWRSSVDQVLVDMAGRVYQAAPFDLALIGEEVSGSASARALTTDELAERGVLLPAAVVHEFKPRGTPIPLASGLTWFPPPT